MTRPTLTQAAIRRIVTAARKEDPAAVIEIVTGETVVRILPGESKPARGGNSCDGAFGKG
jgi:uncharacterized protein (DUF849 family)